jgi:hypothetical protein
MYKPEQLWSEFKTKLIKVLQEDLDPKQLERLKVPSERKYFFDEQVFPSVAKELNLHYKKEFLRIDYSFYKAGSRGWSVPLIFIESENNWVSCYEETLKLCSVTAPLKILLTYGFPQERKEEIENENHSDIYILDDFKEVNTLFGWYVILLYDDSQNKICFHVYAYDENAKLIKSISVPFCV